MARVRIVLTGVKELKRALQQLPPRLKREVLPEAVRRGAEVIQAEAKAQVKKHESIAFIADKVEIAADPNAPQGGAADVVRVRDWNYQGKSYSAASFEYGDLEHAARPFMRPALDHKGSAAINRIKLEIRRGIERLAQSLYRGS